MKFPSFHSSRRTDAEPVSVDEFLARAGRLVSSRTGIIACVELIETAPRDPLPFWARSISADTTAVLGVRALNEGNAASTDRGMAVVKAIGESVERYCAAAVDPDRLRVASWRDLAFDGIHPDRFALFEPEQYLDPRFPAVPFEEDTIVSWISGTSLLHDRPVWVPAAFVHIPFVPQPGESKILPAQVSSGLAAHTSFQRAVFKGLLEVVERDAFMLSWYRGLACPEVDVSGIRNDLILELLHRTELQGYRRHIRLLHTDIPISVLLVAFTSEGTHRPFTIVAAAADPDPMKALQLALEEALLSLHGIPRLLEQETDFQPEPDYSNVNNLRQHSAAHAVSPELRAVMLDALKPAGRIDFADLPGAPNGSTSEQLRWLVSELDSRGHEAIAVDLTTADVDENGLNVVRGLIPGMLMLDVDHRYRHTGGARLRNAVEAAGSSRFPGRLNPYPHPFP